MIGPRHRLLIPFPDAGGALLMLIADLAARTPDPPNEIPIGVVMGSLGGPFFLWMIRRVYRQPVCVMSHLQRDHPVVLID